MSTAPNLPPNWQQVLAALQVPQQAVPVAPVPLPVPQTPAWVKWVGGAVVAVGAILGGFYAGGKWSFASPPAVAPGSGGAGSASAPGSGGNNVTPAPVKKACGKCGSADCGCQTDAQLKALQGAVDALKAAQPPKKTDAQQDPFEAGNSSTPADGRVPDATGRLWIVADRDDADQRSWWSKDGGKTWWRNAAPALVSIPATECKCPAQGNKDGSQGPNNCRCHDMGLDCKCHKGAGIVYTSAPAQAAPAPAPMPQPAPVPQPMPAPMAAPWAAPMIRSAGACAS